MRCLTLCFAFGVSAVSVQAQADLVTPVPAGAETAVHAYTSAFATADWEQVGGVIDPSEPVAMSDLVAFLVEMDTTQATGGLLSDDPDDALIFARFMEPMVQEDWDDGSDG